MLDEDEAAEILSQSLECAYGDLQLIYETGGQEAVSRYIAHINARGLYEYEVEVVLMPDKNAMN